MAEQIPGGAEGRNNWQVIGISRDQWRLIGAALALGGNVRAGLEDNFYLPNGEMARSNGDLIAKARQMAEDVGRRPATVAEARELLGVPKREVPTRRRCSASDRGSQPRPNERAPWATSACSTSRGCCPGGFCSLLLADFGADVVKVEDTGDGRLRPLGAAVLRLRGSDQALGTRSALYLALNRGKRSIRLDLKSEGGRDAMLRLAREFDVVLESFRPGVLDRLGCGYEALREVNPGIVYCAITGYGQTGPEHRPRRTRHELPRPQRPARPDRRARRPADPVGRPDRRPRRRRADGGVRSHGRAARAGALGRGPARRRVDDRRVARLARDGGGPVPVRRPGPETRPGLAHRRLPLLPARTRPPTAGSRAPRSSRSSGARSARAWAAPS